MRPIPSPGSKPNIVVIAVDTLRPDHLGCYGYDLPTSPALDAFAERSMVFDNAIAAGIPTTPSFTTLFTGMHPYLHGIVTHPAGRRLPSGTRTLPEVAADGGYATVALDNMVVVGSGRASWFTRGYRDYAGFVYTPFGNQSSQLTDRGLGFLQEARDQPLFLFVHYWDPHTPYGPRPPYDTMHYRPGNSRVDLDEVRALSPDFYGPFLAEMGLSRPDDYDYVVAQYDGEISQVDQQIGRLLNGIDQLDDGRDSIVLVVSDHGECFGEGDYYFDHHGLYDAVTRIVCMLRAPDTPAGRTDALISHEDLLPTLCDLAGLPLPEQPLTGHSLVPLLGNRTNRGRHIRPWVVSVECSRQASLAFRTPDEKVILPVVRDANGESIPDFYGNERSADPLLFDLARDPGEHDDRSASEPERLRGLLDRLHRWRTDMVARTGEPDPLLTQPLGLPFERFVERMRVRAEADRR